MVHGILQFTPRIAFRYVLHRCESRDIRCRESYFYHWPRHPTQALGRLTGALAFIVFLGVIPRRIPATDQRARKARGTRPVGPRRQQAPPRQRSVTCATVVFLRGNDNDPSAGSPTETLLRLLLPLNDKVQWTSRDVTGGEPPASPRSEHFTGPFNR